MRSRASRYSGNDSNSQRVPVRSALRSMPSTTDRFLQHRLAQRRRARRDAEAAVAHDRGGDAERRRRRELRVPGGLRVVVRVHVDDARHQGEAAGIQGLARRAGRGDAAVLYRDVGDAAGIPGTVVHGGAAEQEVVHVPGPCVGLRRARRASENTSGRERRAPVRSAVPPRTHPPSGKRSRPWRPCRGACRARWRRRPGSRARRPSGRGTRHRPRRRAA